MEENGEVEVDAPDMAPQVEGVGTANNPIFEPVMGINQNCHSIDLLDCVTEGKKRGKKSLIELRILDGLAGDQGKLTDFFDAGKGKVLPREP